MYILMRINTTTTTNNNNNNNVSDIKIALLSRRLLLSDRVSLPVPWECVMPATVVSDHCCVSLLLRSWERWRSIVVSTSVCLSVCRLRAYRPNHTCDLYQIFAHVAFGRGSVFLRRGDEIPREGAILGASSQLTMHCTA